MEVASEPVCSADKRWLIWSRCWHGSFAERKRKTCMKSTSSNPVINSWEGSTGYSADLVLNFWMQLPFSFSLLPCRWLSTYSLKKWATRMKSMCLEILQPYSKKKCLRTVEQGEYKEAEIPWEENHNPIMDFVKLKNEPLWKTNVIQQPKVPASQQKL